MNPSHSRGMTHTEAMTLTRELRKAGCDPYLLIIGEHQAVRCNGQTGDCLTCPGRAMLRHFEGGAPC